jgi:hypothetical protein
MTLDPPLAVWGWSEKPETMMGKFHRRRCSWTTIIVNGIVLGGVVVMESSGEERSTDHDPKKLKCSLWEEGLASAATMARSQIRNVRMYDRKKEKDKTETLCVSLA